MMLEEKQRGSSAKRERAATETDCSDLEQSLHTAREHLQQSQYQKKQLMENMDKAKEGLEEAEKAISTVSRKTPQQVLFRIPQVRNVFFFISSMGIYCC